ncbi:MAG: SDR family oxidoreductase [Kiritimatiellae bacterium]|nr:SDR family oxidoreductase [Kiritimatiellia bacterium]
MPKHALVTGAGTGIGRAIARELAKAGYDVALHCNASRDGAESAAAEIRALGRRAEVYQADLSDLAAIDGMFEAFRKDLERLDLFVNNAGITLLAPFLEMTPEAFDKNYAVDFRAPYFCMQKAAKMMVEQGNGNIVAIASNNAYCQFACASAYAAMKAGLVKMVRSIGLEMAKYGIRVNAIAPGWTDTGAARLDAKESTYYKIPLRRWVQPEEVGQAVLFFDSPAAASITGVTLVMDGGAQLLSDKGEKYGFEK